MAGSFNSLFSNVVVLIVTVGQVTDRYKEKIVSDWPIHINYDTY